MKKNDVVIVDDESSGKIDNIKHMDLSKIDTTFGSINTINLDEIFDGADYVYHLAAVTSVPQSVMIP